jgi:hypothetical protein
MEQRLSDLLARAVAYVNSLTPEERDEMARRQIASSVKAMRERHAAGDFEDATVQIVLR